MMQFLPKTIPLVLVGCQFLTEQRADPSSVTWSGTVYADTPSDTAPVLTGGSVDVVDLDGAALASGTEPFDDSPGYWQVDVPTETEVAIRLAGPDSVNTVFRSTTPSGRGYWFSGALFARGTETATGFFDSLSGVEGLDPSDLSDGEIAHLWGEPLDPETFADADLWVVDGAGVEHDVVTFVADDLGALSDAGAGPVDLFVATDLAPGTVALEVELADGTRSTTTFPALGGDLLSPIFLAPGSGQ